MVRQAVETNHINVENGVFNDIKGLVEIPPVERKIDIEFLAPGTSFGKRAEKNDRADSQISLTYTFRKAAEVFGWSTRSAGRTP
jgi:hypothetical protein